MSRLFHMKHSRNSTESPLTAAQSDPGCSLKAERSVMKRATAFLKCKMSIEKPEKKRIHIDNEGLYTAFNMIFCACGQYHIAFDVKRAFV
jgi:hypothetical protein